MQIKKQEITANKNSLQKFIKYIWYFLAFSKFNIFFGNSTVVRTIFNRYGTGLQKLFACIFTTIYIFSYLLSILMCSLIIAIITQIAHLPINSLIILNITWFFLLLFVIEIYILPLLFKKGLNTKTIYFYPTQKWAVNLSLRLLLNKKDIQKIDFSNKAKFFEIHTKDFETKKMSQFTFVRYFYNDLKQLANTLNFKEIHFFVHTPLPLMKMLNKLPNKIKIDIQGPYTPTRMSIPLQGKENEWYVYILKVYKQ